MKMIRSVKFQNMCRTDIVDLEIVTWSVKFIPLMSSKILSFRYFYRNLTFENKYHELGLSKDGPCISKNLLEFNLRKTLYQNQNSWIINAGFSSLRLIVLAFLHIISRFLKNDSPKIFSISSQKPDLWLLKNNEL